MSERIRTGFFGKQVRETTGAACSVGGQCQEDECEQHREKISVLRYTKTEGGDWHYITFHSVELPDGMIWDSHCEGPRK